VDKPPTLIIRIKEISSLACESYGELRLQSDIETRASAAAI
jgi:hypothetical protein